MKIIRAIYTGYGVMIFAILFLIALPFLFVPVYIRSAHPMVGIVNRWWARLMYFFIFIPCDIQYRAKLHKDQRYIFCSNHFSYLDIPTMGLVRHNTVFVGKTGIEKIPLFGYMYGKLHITVDRSKLKSRYESVKRSMSAIDEGKSLVIYPEGGIITKGQPVMGLFKDGAMRIAIEKQIPIVPVTIPYNWIILPPEEFLLRWHRLKVIFHEPIETKGKTLADTDAVKQQLFDVINQELKSHLS